MQRRRVVQLDDEAGQRGHRPSMIPCPGPRSAGPGITSPRSPEMAFRVRLAEVTLTGGRERRIPEACRRGRRRRTPNPFANPRLRFPGAQPSIWSLSGGGPTAAEQALRLKITGFLAVVVLDRDHREADLLTSRDLW